MIISTEVLALRNQIRDFVQSQVEPYVQQIENSQIIDDDLIRKLADRGYLGANIPKQYGGINLNSIELGILHEELGKGHASVENIITVVGMVSCALLRGSTELKNTWLPKIATAQTIPAFALTEPEVGSDIQNIQTQFLRTEYGYILNGRKKWITLGSRADIFIVFARNSYGTAAFLVPRNIVGLKVYPIRDMLGFRGNMLAEIHLENCLVPFSHLVGLEKGGIELIGLLALNEGRYTTAWGAIGLAEAAFGKALDYVKQRRQFGSLLKDHDIIKEAIAKMYVSIEASRQLCLKAGKLREEGDQEEIKACLIAKYHSSKTAVFVAEKAVQLMGAWGCSQQAGVEQYFRNAKLFELIEGASEILEIKISDLILLDGLNT